MDSNLSQPYEYTDHAWASFSSVVNDRRFSDADARLIYHTLERKLRFIPFGDYLRRYIYQTAGLSAPFAEVPVQEYQDIILDSFSDRHTPPSFQPTSSKLSALVRNWLTQQSVKRQVVLLLGFGLAMPVHDVNQFLTKALREQSLNTKDPFEILCLFCYSRGYGYLMFQKLWAQYLALDGDAACPQVELSESDICSIPDDTALLACLRSFRAGPQVSTMQSAARNHFLRLYREACIFLAGNTAPGEKPRSPEDISEADLERVLCSAIPLDRHGNLAPARESALYRQFSGKRFSRQHIHSILQGKTEISRFDLITLNFYRYSQLADDFPSPSARYRSFLADTNTILSECSMDRIYVTNPYECFVLMCMLTDDPLGTYADVWELSYTDVSGKLLSPDARSEPV